MHLWSTDVKVWNFPLDNHTHSEIPVGVPSLQVPLLRSTPVTWRVLMLWLHQMKNQETKNRNSWLKQDQVAQKLSKQCMVRKILTHHLLPLLASKVSLQSIQVHSVRKAWLQIHRREIRICKPKIRLKVRWTKKVQLQNTSNLLWIVKYRGKLLSLMSLSSATVVARVKQVHFIDQDIQ